jgi:AcrR family transcriptional regulator
MASTPAAPPAARPYHHGALREALVAAAEQIVEEVGPDRITLREAARRAGVSHAAPAHHFGDLGGLLTAVAARGFERLGGALAAAAAAAPPAEDALTATGRAYVQFALAHPGLFQLMFRTRALDQNAPQLAAAADQAFAVLAGASPAQPGRAGDARARMGQLVGSWALVHGFAVLAIDGRLDGVLRDAGTDLAGLLESVLAPPSSGC